MSAIALKHGGTVDKFIGDALVIFFGDSETKGTVEDARACLNMATEMQRRLAELNVQWRRAGTEQPFRVRMGINTASATSATSQRSLPCRGRLWYRCIGGRLI